MLGAYLEGNQPHLEGHLLQIRSLDVSFKTDKQRLFLWQVVRSYFCQPPGLGWNLKAQDSQACLLTCPLFMISLFA